MDLLKQVGEFLPRSTDSLFGPSCPESSSPDRRGPEYRSFVELSDGITHYELRGRDEDPLVVLVHGLTSPLFVWDYQIEPLLRSGYQVLRYDLYGRGLSDRPTVRYDEELFHRQMRDLLRTVAENEPYGLVGLSLGGAISVGAVARRRVDPEKLLLIAPAGLRATMPWWFYLAVMPGVLELYQYTIGGWCWSYVGSKSLSDDPEKQRKAREYLRQQLDFPGFHRALISTVRHGPIYGIREHYRELGRRSMPVRVLWSREDSVVPSILHEELDDLVPRADVSLLREGKHTVNYDRPELVNPTMMDFFGKAPGNPLVSS
jgi:pimeloyl-ACP methyl ester carboxylesterase